METENLKPPFVIERRSIITTERGRRYVTRPLSGVLFNREAAEQMRGFCEKLHAKPRSHDETEVQIVITSL